uniref:C2 NT-type domain-containing protein n=1 Tax=Nelumbo nucifera TaxID=4432 RepID=A0A822Y9B0_NELNU|nr:TPA_asm: hypothetical protein HUJ06_030465 [Nelumbo nucifera]
MVVKMMKWRPWPPLLSKKFEVKLVLRRMEGFQVGTDEGEKSGETRRLMVEIRWKGPKVALSSLRRTLKRNFTKEEEAKSDGVVEWNEEFQSVLKSGPKNKVPVVGTALLSIAEFASTAEEKELEINVPLILLSGNVDPQPSLCLSLRLLELRTTQEHAETVPRSIVPVPLSPQSGESISAERDDFSALKAGLRKVKIFTEYVSTQRSKKAFHEEEGSEGRCSARSDNADCIYPFDTDSLDDFDDGELEDGKGDSSFRKSFNYGTLAYANSTERSFYSDKRISEDYEDWIYYSNRKSDVSCLHVKDSVASISDQASSKRSILPWRKRKLSFRSPKSKGEPLLKKAYAEEGGDDIDYDRRQLSSSDESFSLGWHKADEDSSANRSSMSEFGDDNFAVGNWEQKEIISRDGHMKLQTQVFFASIDQRSERAAGESACTALVAVIADWFQTNRDAMPIKSEFDSLIREGSLEWRNLCENQMYRERFPNKHFDLETILQAKIRPLSVVPRKSFIGFFRPDAIDEEGFDFLHGAMSFDNIWDEISHAGMECPNNGDLQIYIISWNDHFFVLKVEPEAYYIIDTLGERLFEGCNQAYILQFDKHTTIRKMPSEAQTSEEKAAGDQQRVPAAGESRTQQNNHKEAPAAGPPVPTKPDESGKTEAEEEVMCRGKESCKEYIKNFLAAIPIRELQADIKKGLMASTPLHHRLQIEFHYTELQQPEPEPPAEATSVAQMVVAVTEVAC